MRILETFFVSFLLLPPLFFRIISRNKDASPCSPIFKIFENVYGFSQDIFLLILCAFTLSLSHSFTPAILGWIVPFLISFLVVVFFVDGFVHKTSMLRLEVPFLKFFLDIRCFWDSAKEKKIAWLYPLCFTLFVLLGFSFSKVEFIENNWRYFFSYKTCSFLLIILFSGKFFFSKKVLYHVDNILFFHLSWVATRFYRLLVNFFLKSASKSSEFNFFSKNEDYTFSKLDPFLKFTNGFSGEKNFNIKLNPKVKPNIIFLFLESFRSKDIGASYSRKSVTPNFDRLSGEGIFFENFYANSVKTSRALSSFLFGFPSDPSSFEISFKTKRNYISLAKILKDHEYKTAYFHNGELEFENQKEFLEDYGYELLFGKKEILKEFSNPSCTSWGLDDEYLMDFSLKWIKENQNKERPFFMTLFTISNHHPWNSPHKIANEPLDLSLNEPYSRFLKTMRYTDEQLGRFVESLKENDLFENTLLFILGDHGHPMGEHHENFIQQKYLYEENIKVPLLILGGAKMIEPSRLQQIGSHIDLLPTLLDLLKISSLNHTTGSSLLRSSSPSVYFHNPYFYKFYGLREGKMKFIFEEFTEKQELFDLEADPFETKNLAELSPELSSKFLNQVKAYKEHYSFIYQNYFSQKRS